MRRLYILFLLLLVVLSSCHTRRKSLRREEEAQETISNNKAYDHRYTTTEYIETFKRVAIREKNKYGIPASIILAQGILESNSGNSELARNANNHFGIKSTNDWDGKTYCKNSSKNNTVYRKYPSVEASFRDHSEFLTHSRYVHLFRYRSDDYKRWARGLKKAGYATNPKYPELLIDLINKYELWQYD